MTIATAVIHLLAVPALALSNADTLTIRFIGNAAFELSDGRVTLVTDLPYQSGAFGYMTYNIDAVHPPGQVVSVITHRHSDHYDRDLFEQRGWLMVGPEEITSQLSPDRVVPFEPEIHIGDFTIVPFTTRHRDTEHYSYMITWRGHRLYFTGDTEDPTQLLAMEELDIAFVTPWLLCEVASRGATIRTRQIVLHHQFPDRQPRACLSPRTMAQEERLTLVTGSP